MIMNNIQYTNTICNEDIISLYQSPTGHTQQYKGDNIFYVVGTTFEKIYNKSERSLHRWKRTVRETVHESEHPYYFICQNGVYWYSSKILDVGGRKKKKQNEIPLTEPITIEHDTFSFTSTSSAIFQRIKRIKWDYYCGARTKNELDVSKCVGNMKKLYYDLMKKMPDVIITLFYMTEDDDGNNGDNLHNHFVLAVSENGKKTTKLIEQSIRGIGALIPDVRKYDSECKGLEYMIKKINRFPDGWGVITNSKLHEELLHNTVYP